jgi:hypothetical protein
MTKIRFLIRLIIVSVALSLTVALIHAQETQPLDEELMPEAPEAVVDNVIPIQGRLTDASGNPLNGTYNIVASIYDTETGGVARCADLASVTVENGLFNMNIDTCNFSDINGDQLWLGIQAGTDPMMTPRQPIYPVPYAFTVRPGTTIKGATSYLFVPGMQILKNAATDTTRWIYSSGGLAEIHRGASAGAKTIRIPITIPAVLYGQPVRVTNARIYYRCENGGTNYITATELARLAADGTVLSIVSDGTNRQSNTYTFYDLPGAYNNNTLSQDAGVLALTITIQFANDTQYVRIGGIRLTLVTNY